MCPIFDAAADGLGSGTTAILAAAAR